MTPSIAGAGIAVAVGGIAVGVAGCDVGVGSNVAVGGIAVGVAGCDVGVGSDVAVGGIVACDVGICVGSGVSVGKPTGMEVGVAGGGAGACSDFGVGADRGVKVGTIVGSGMGDAVTTTACVTSGRIIVATDTLATVGASVNIGTDVTFESVSVAASALLHAATTSVRNNDAIVGKWGSRTRMPVLVGRIIRQTQMITRYFDSTHARLSERVHFLRPTVVYVDLLASSYLAG